MKVTDAVHYMHSQDPIVIHQDLKPQNVLVSAIDDYFIIICHGKLFHVGHIGS